MRTRKKRTLSSVERLVTSFFLSSADCPFCLRAKCLECRAIIFVRSPAKFKILMYGVCSVFFFFIFFPGFGKENNKKKKLPLILKKKFRKNRSLFFLRDFRFFFRFPLIHKLSTVEILKNSLI